MDKELLLIKESIEGNEDSFSEIVNIYKNYVFAIILSFIKDYDEVENVAQEVFLQIYVSLPSYDNNNFKAWISRITSNKSIDWIRKKKSKFKEELLEDSQTIIDIVGVDQKDNPEILLVEKENKETLFRTLNGLPDIYREVIEDFYFKEKSYEQIAKDKDVTVKTIASRLYRGKNMLKEKWREENENGTLWLCRMATI